jgi:hypothetical protein
MIFLLYALCNDFEFLLEDDKKSSTQFFWHHIYVDNLSMSSKSLKIVYEIQFQPGKQSHRAKINCLKFIQKNEAYINQSSNLKSKHCMQGGFHLFNCYARKI